MDAVSRNQLHSQRTLKLSTANTDSTSTMSMQLTLKAHVRGPWFYMYRPMSKNGEAASHNTHIDLQNRKLVHSNGDGANC